MGTSSINNLKRFLLFVIFSTTLFKLWSATLYPITCDEAYYWLWQKHLAWSYVDHPPLIAVLNWLTGRFGEYHLLLFRSVAVFLTLVTSWIIYHTAKLINGQRTALIATALFLLVPYYLIFWQVLTIDNLLGLFWASSLYSVVRIIKREEPWMWFVLGLFFGLGCLSKYTMVFFVPPLLLLFASQQKLRHWFLKPQPYLAFVLALFIFSPVLGWNYVHGWQSFTFHGSRIAFVFSTQNLLQLMADQLLHFTPMLFLGLFFASPAIYKKSPVLFWFSIPTLLIFMFITFFIKVFPMWIFVYQIASIIGIALAIQEKGRRTLLLLGSMTIFALLLNIALLTGVSTLLPRQAEYNQNRNLKNEFLKLSKETIIITPYLGSSAQVTFYSGGRKTYMAQGLLKVEGKGFAERQFLLWGQPKILTGDTIIYYGPDDETTQSKLKQAFTHSIKRPDLKLYLIEGWLDKLVPFECKGYKGSIIL